jgi:hypothetical protein
MLPVVCAAAGSVTRAAVNTMSATPALSHRSFIAIPPRAEWKENENA